MACGGIYTIRNKSTGRFYVGSSKHIPYRFRSHLSELRAGKHHCRFLQHAWNKYGEEDFSFEIHESGTPPDELLWREQCWIDTYMPTGFLYNAAPIAGNCLGVKHSAETRARRSIALKAAKRPDDIGSRISAGKKGKPLSDRGMAVVLAIAEKRRFKLTLEEARHALNKHSGGMHWAEIAAGFGTGVKSFRAAMRSTLGHERLPRQRKRRSGYAVGAEHRMAKLTEDQVREIRKANGSAAKIALEYGVSRHCIFDIKAGRSWAHVI